MKIIHIEYIKPVTSFKNSAVSSQQTETELFNNQLKQAEILAHT